MFVRRYLRGPHVSWVQATHQVGEDERGLLVVDHHLDIVVSPHREWRWNDEDTFAASTGVPGFWSPPQARAIRAEGERVIAAVEAARFPFDGTWCDFRPDPAWPIPSLPPGPL